MCVPTLLMDVNPLCSDSSDICCLMAVCRSYDHEPKAQREVRLRRGLP